MRFGRAIESMLRNLRFAIRALARTPGFTSTVVLTLAVAIGANRAVFSVVDTILRPLPFPNAGRLVQTNHVAEPSSVAIPIPIPPVRLSDWDQRSSNRREAQVARSELAGIFCACSDTGIRSTADGLSRG